MQKRRWKIILRELFIALGILLIFLFFGQNLLEFITFKSESVSIAGGIILFLIGLKMIFPSRMVELWVPILMENH